MVFLHPGVILTIKGDRRNECLSFMKILFGLTGYILISVKPQSCLDLTLIGLLIEAEYEIEGQFLKRVLKIISIILLRVLLEVF